MLHSVAICSILGILIVFKYLDFLASGLSNLFGGGDVALGLLLPAGISFYTFQSLSYCVDVYRGDIRAERHPGYYALFVSFFPQLVAGPIERPSHLLPQLKNAAKATARELSDGLWLMGRGFLKKLAVADYLAPMVDAVYAAPQNATGSAVVLGTVLFAIQIYCDFSGYSDIAQGCARMLGIRLSDNFRQPYGAGSIREFWRRWHISLTTWFTDYLYIPLGGSRKGILRQWVNLLVVFLVSGLWHGAAWHFLVWGGIHGLYRIAGTLWRKRFPTQPRGRLWNIFGVVRTFALVCFAWIFFRASNLSDAFTLIGRLPLGWNTMPDLSGLARLPVLLLCLYLLSREDVSKKPILTQACSLLYLLFLIAAAWLTVIAGGGGNAFIYFQF